LIEEIFREDAVDSAGSMEIAMPDESMPEFDDMESEEFQTDPADDEWADSEGNTPAQGSLPEGENPAAARHSNGAAGNGQPAKDHRSAEAGPDKRRSNGRRSGRRRPARFDPGQEAPPQAEFVEFQFPEAAHDPFDLQELDETIPGPVYPDEEEPIPADILEDFLGAPPSGSPGRPGEDPGDPLATQLVSRVLQRGSQAGDGRILRSAARMEGQTSPGAGWLKARACSLDQWEAAALLQALAKEASGSGSETAAAALAASMVPIALRFEPGVTRALWPALPALILGVEGLARLFYHHPEAEALFDRLPLILQRTMASLADSIRAGRSPGWRMAAAVLARHTAQALGGPTPVNRGVTYLRKRK
jgi:hypothetical protein